MNPETYQLIPQQDHPDVLDGLVLCVWHSLIDSNPSDHPNIMRTCYQCWGYNQDCKYYTKKPNVKTNSEELKVDSNVEEFVENFGKPHSVCQQCPTKLDDESFIKHRIKVVQR
jgi:hypothetical protein